MRRATATLPGFKPPASCFEAGNKNSRKAEWRVMDKFAAAAAAGTVLMLSACAFDVSGADDTLVTKQLGLAIWLMVSACWFTLNGD